MAHSDKSCDIIIYHSWTLGEESQQEPPICLRQQEKRKGLGQCTNNTISSATTHTYRVAKIAKVKVCKLTPEQFATWLFNGQRMNQCC
jgi:hypothetical protein